MLEASHVEHSHVASTDLRFRDRHGREVVTRIHRAGRGEAVVLVHGVGARASIWQPQFEALRARFDVIAYDMWGHGESSCPPDGALLEDYSAQLLGVLEQLGVPRCHVIGHSMGALIAIEFALSHPQRVSSVCALNAVFCRSTEQRRAVEERAAAFERRAPLVWDSTISRWFGDPLPDAAADVAMSVRNSLLFSA